MPQRSMDQELPGGPPAGGASEDRAARAWPVLETVHSSLIAMGAAFMGLAPRLLPSLLAVIAIVTVIEVLRSGRPGRQVLSDVFSPLPMRAAVALLAFAGLSSLWASDRLLALTSVVQVALLVLSAGALIALLPGHISRLPPTRKERFTRAVPIGFLLGLAFLVVEFATGNALSLAFVNHFPAIVGDSAKDAVRQGDRVVGFMAFYLDRNVAALMLMLPATVVATMLWLPRPLALWLAVTGVVVALGVAAVSASSTAKLAAVVGGLAAIAVARWPQPAMRTISALLAAGIVLALPLGHVPSLLGMETAPWLAPSARERAMIWDRTATAARRTPIAGTGVQSTRFQEADRTVKVDGLQGERRQLGWHAHNVVLQTWLELGAIGALLLLALGVTSIRAIAGLATDRQPAAMALVAMVVGVGLTGWGMWQPWLIASFGMSLCALWVTQPVKA